MKKEIWKPIQALDGAYEASTDGKIRNTKTKHIKAVVFDGHYYKFGYDYVFNGKRNRGWYRVHKAVAETFITNERSKPTVNHINGDKSDNSVANLEWATAKEQSAHAASVLSKNCGEKQYNAKHTNEEVREIRRLYESGVATISQLAKAYNETYQNTRRIVKYERWKYI